MSHRSMKLFQRRGSRFLVAGVFATIAFMFAAPSFAQSTGTIQGNVVHATHGETRQEVLGSGDATQELQSFTLHQRPLTYVSAPTPDGIASTLHVRVDGVEWHRADTLAGRAPAERVFLTDTDDQDRTAVVFGTGRQGARRGESRYRRSTGR